MSEENKTGDQGAAGTPPNNDGTPPAGDQGAAGTPPAGTDDGDQFPRAYVEKLRGESAGYRERATTAEETAGKLQTRLHAAIVAADGRLADPTALQFDAEHLDSPELLDAAITDLIEKQPHLKARAVGGDIGAGNRGGSSDAVPDLISLIRGH